MALGPGEDVRLWGGGFDAPLHPALRELSFSLAQDLPLAAEDCTASAAWAMALADCGVLSGMEAARIASELVTLRADLDTGRWVPAGAEDIHGALEAELVRRTGDLGRKLHTGRSRNDQVATAFRMAVRSACTRLASRVRSVQQSLVERAVEEMDTLLPAYTHLQRAQPVRLAHWLLAHFWPLERDVERLRAARRAADVLPLGSGAIAGTSFAIDRDALASRLGFAAVGENSYDAVGDRDFALDFAYAGAVLAVHLSRLADELVLWSTAEYGFVHWPDSLATGSSLMPNKKNPDLAELVRGRSGTAIGDLVALLVLLKGVPAGYQRDLQEDKPPVWRTATTLGTSLAAMHAGLAELRFDRARMQAALSDEILATDAADALVARGVPFRTAHAAVGEAVAMARRRGIALRALGESNDALPAPLERRDLSGLDFEAAVERRAARGGTARRAVEAQLEEARRRLQEPS